MQALKDSFEIFQNRDAYFEKVGEDAYPSNILQGQILLIFITSMDFEWFRSGTQGNIYTTLFQAF
jgi:hypothetical protein